MFQVIQPERALYIQANNCVEARDWIDILTKVSQCNRKRLSTYHPSAYLNGHWLCCKLSADTAPGCTPCTGYVTFFQHVSSITYLSLFVDSLILPYASVFSGLPANIQLDVDGDRETERIYSLFSTYMTKLIKMQGQTLARCMCMILSFLCLRSPSPPPTCPVLSLYCPSLPAEACGSKSVYDGPEQEEYSSFVIDDPQETYKTLKLIVTAVQTLEQQHTKYKRDKFKKTKIGSQ